MATPQRRRDSPVVDHTLRAQLIRDEGERLHAYRDSLGFWTIGIGHCLGSGDKPRMTWITPDELDALYSWDVMLAERRARRWVPSWPALDLPRQRVILNMAFNLGDRLREFVRLRAAIARQDWVRAAESMTDSLWARQVGERAVRLRDAMLTGQDA